MPNWIGDLVMATPVLHDLRKAFPEASITAMCKYPICELLREDESIDELFCFSKPVSNFSRREHRDITAKIETGKFDVAVLLTNSFSSAWWCWQGKIPRRIGYPGHYRRWLLTDAITKPQEKLHQVGVYTKVLEPLNIPRSTTAPSLFVSEKEIKESKELLYQRGYQKGQKLIGINPGAAYGSAKCWLPERFQKLALELSKDASVVFFGDAATSGLIKQICKDLPPKTINLAGITSLRELACLIKDCDLLITNDSGPMHIADAFRTPLIALFGSTDDLATGPFNQKNSVINKRVACSPCFKRVCPIDFPCMKEIQVDEVISFARELLRKGRV